MGDALHRAEFFESLERERIREPRAESRAVPQPMISFSFFSSTFNCSSSSSQACSTTLTVSDSFPLQV